MADPRPFVRCSRRKWGAHAAGELASKLATDLIPHLYKKIQEQAPAEALHKAVTESNAEIFRRGQANIEFRNMGTTCSLLCMLPEGAVIAHVGDSRVYQLHGDKLYQLTFDHSLVWEMLAGGEVTDRNGSQRCHSEKRHYSIFRPQMLQCRSTLRGPFPIQKGDRFLLCSDGLSGQITDEEIGAILRTLEPKYAAQLFVDLSNLRGGPDNITAVVAEAVDPRIMTSGQGSLTVNRRGTKKQFSTALGVVTAVCLLAALTILVMIPDLWALAVVTSVLGLIALATGFAQVFWSSNEPASTEVRYGNGPYRSYPAVATLALFEHLAGTMKALREAATERQWKIHWGPIDELFRTARAAADAGNFSLAVQNQSMVIIRLMEQIRRQRRGDPSDSAIDL